MPTSYDVRIWRTEKIQGKRSNAQTHSLLAQLAMTTQTRGQMWAVVSIDDNNCFTPQKMVLLSSEFWA